METDVLIIGGGLAGLSLAFQLEQAGRDYQLVEARSRLGGRIHSCESTYKTETACFDLGPAWFWPGQPRMADLVKKLELRVFEQYAQGDLMFEDEHAQVHRGQGYASMAGSYRINGGMSQLIDGLQGFLNKSRLRLDASASHIRHQQAGLSTIIADPLNQTTCVQSQSVVLALPPRVAAERIVFDPVLPGPAINAMSNIPTWMAGQAKILAIYHSPFWREAGLSGDAMSRRGPLVEIHDASPETGSPYALFGFVGVPARYRNKLGSELITQAQNQLQRLFGDMAAKPLSLTLQDWAGESLTATDLDWTPVNQHPNYGLPEVLSHLWDGSLLLGSTEIAAQFGGYLEGALEAAEHVFQRISQ